MSKAVKKVFKGVKKAVKGVGDAVSGAISKTTEFVQKNWKEIVLVSAAVFTAGAALGYVGMSASGGLAFSGFGSTGVGAFGGGIAQSGIGAAWGGLGNTVAGALGMDPQFGATALAQGGSPAATQTAALQTGGGFQAATAANAAAPAANVGAVEGAASAVNTVGAGATSAQAVSQDIAKKGLLEKIGGLGGAAQVGGLGLATYGALQGGEDEDDMEYAEYDPYAPNVASAQDVVGSGIQATPGGNRQAGLMQPKRTSRQSSRDDEARRRYGRAYA